MGSSLWLSNSHKAGGGEIVVDLVVVGQLLVQKGGGKDLAGRMAEDRRPPRDQAGLEGWLQDGRGLLDLAKSRMKLAAAALHLPPTSMASTTSLHRRDASNSG